MAFAVDDRVRCIDQSSHYREKYGTVISVDGDDHQVRPDGFPVDQTVLLRTEQLSGTSLASPIDYSEAE